MEMGTSGVRRLLRRTDGKVIAGVAGGLGDYFGVDPVWFRIGFVLLALLGGSGIVAYGVLWLLMPDDPAATPTSLQRRMEGLADSLRETPSWIGVALVVVGGLLLASQVTHWKGGIFWGIALITLGVALFRRHEATRESNTRPAPSSPPGPPLSQTPASAPGIPRSVAPRREHSGLGSLTVGATIVALGIATLLDAADVASITLVQYLSLALTLLGGGILVGAWFGRARWLAVPAVMLVPIVLAASLIHVPFTGGSGDVVFRPATAAAIEPAYHQVAGRLVIDLRATKLGGAAVSIRATEVAGRILVQVPAAASVTIHGRVGAGEVKLFGRAYDGFNVDVQRSFGPAQTKILRLDLEASFGQVEVQS